MKTVSTRSDRLSLLSSALPRLTARTTSTFRTALVAGLALCATAAQAASPVAVGARAGTIGLGADLTLKVSDRTHLRLAAGALSYDTTVSTADLEYDVNADLGTGLLLLDWYPGGGSFRISVGGGWNGTEADVSAPVERLVRGLFPDLPAISLDFGTITGTAQGDDLVPALLVGWGNPFRGGRWNLSFEIGAIYQGSPGVDLRYRDGEDFQLDDIPGGRAVVDALLAEEERKLEDELEDYTVLPVVSFTLSYRF